MSKEFEEWYKIWSTKTSRYSASPDKSDVRRGWNACKQKILEDIIKPACNEKGLLIAKHIIDQIEKL